MAGDDPDFLEFFAGEFWPLRRVGFLLTGDWDQAEELAQEAMARTYAVWRRVRGYDRPQPDFGGDDLATRPAWPWRATCRSTACAGRAGPGRSG
jgi:hypothetical protein